VLWPMTRIDEIDWQKLYQATSTSNHPTPGYLFNEIVQNVSHARPADLPAVATYLADCVDGDHAHVKLKALFVIKTLAYRVPPFCKCMQERLSSCQEATVFTGPPSEMFGDEPYRLVREAAEGAVTALTRGEFYHEQYREMSQRIIGFGNYQPDEDSVLPDGDINVGRDVTYRDLAASTIGLVSGGVGSLIWGVKDMLASPFAQSKQGLEGLGDDDDEDEDAVDPYGKVDNTLEHDDPGEQEVEGYVPSTGSYVPPMVPLVPIPPAEDPQAPAHFDVDEELFDDSVAAAYLDSLVGDVVEEPPQPSAPGLEVDKGTFMQLLGIGSTDAIEEKPRADPAPLPDAEGDLSEAAILDILGLGARQQTRGYAQAAGGGEAEGHGASSNTACLVAASAAAVPATGYSSPRLPAGTALAEAGFMEV